MKHSFASAERFILSREFFGLKLGLENIGRFLSLMASPQTAYDTIHLAGTNGKGSTAAMLAAILRAAGYRTGLFTSPHLVSLRERIQVDGGMIPKRSVIAFIDRYRKELTRTKLSFFEVVTAMAFFYFERARVDIAVIETGLGGRLDATNVLQPGLTITTDISLDHTEILGSTLEKIGGEKAGIIKTAVPHLVGLLPIQAERVIRSRCRELGAPFHKLLRREFVIRPKTGQLDFTANGYKFTNLSPSLLGAHQLRNSALALKAVSILNETGMSISKTAADSGLAKTQWPGRFQVIEADGKPTLVLDVCHNAAGVRAFVDAFKVRFPNRKAHVISGFVKRKPHQLMFDTFAEIAQDHTLVPLRTNRTTDLLELLETTDFRDIPFRKSGSLSSAYRRLQQSKAPDDIIVIAGSHFLVGEYFDKFGWK